MNKVKATRKRVTKMLESANTAALERDQLIHEVSDWMTDVEVQYQGLPPTTSEQRYGGLPLFKMELVSKLLSNYLNEEDPKEQSFPQKRVDVKCFEEALESLCHFSGIMTKILSNFNDKKDLMYELMTRSLILTSSLLKDEVIRIENFKDVNRGRLYQEETDLCNSILKNLLIEKQHFRKHVLNGVLEKAKTKYPLFKENGIQTALDMNYLHHLEQENTHSWKKISQLNMKMEDMLTYSTNTQEKYQQLQEQYTEYQYKTERARRRERQEMEEKQKEMEDKLSDMEREVKRLRKAKIDPLIEDDLFNNPTETEKTLEKKWDNYESTPMHNDEKFTRNFLKYLEQLSAENILELLPAKMLDRLKELIFLSKKEHELMKSDNRIKEKMLQISSPDSKLPNMSPIASASSPDGKYHTTDHLNNSYSPDRMSIDGKNYQVTNSPPNTGRIHTGKHTIPEEFEMMHRKPLDKWKKRREKILEERQSNMEKILRCFLKISYEGNMYGYFTSLWEDEEQSTFQMQQEKLKRKKPLSEMVQSHHIHPDWNGTQEFEKMVDQAMGAKPRLHTPRHSGSFSARSSVELVETMQTPRITSQQRF